MSKKIAKTLSILLLLTAVAVSQVPVSDAVAQTTASDFQMEGSKLLRYTGTSEVVSIPYDVKVIGEEAFAGNDKLVKVTIGGKVEKIEYRAFADCDKLRIVEVGDSVEEIDTAAFSNDDALVDVNLGAGLRKLGTGVFAGSRELASLSLSADNTHLVYSGGVLYDSDMTKVYALMPAYERGALVLPNTISEIIGYAFWGNPYLQKVTLGSGLYEIPAYAFSGCTNLQEVVIPLPVRGIGAKAFEDCVNLQTVSVPESITRISDTAFDGCPRVKLNAVPGTYGAEYAAKLSRSDVEEVEYEDVQDSQTVDVGEISNQTESTPWPENSQTGSGEGLPQVSPGNMAPLVSEPTASPTTMPTPVPANERLLGESSIVTGRAVIFIDNSSPQVLQGETVTKSVDLSQQSQGSTETISILTDNAQKGADFPKYTIVDDLRIASQAYYQAGDLSEYEIPEGIAEIGEFAFARSGLNSVVIPEGVTRIGYGAFYHCDQLTGVSVPATVTEIEAYAFDNTPWIQQMVTDVSPYLIVGDGILIAYGGGDSVVNIPDNVKQIGPGVFRDHMGITAVNIPASVQVIGEEAFMGCRNLKTVNGGTGLVEIRDRAFMDCPLSQVLISATVEKIGLGAYALQGGTDTAVFEGNQLPSLSVGKSAQRLSNESYRTYALGGIKNAIVPDSIANAADLAGTVLDPGTYGFSGTVTTEAGTLISDNRSGVKIADKEGVSLQISSSAFTVSGGNAAASIQGNSNSYLLQIRDSQEATQQITEAYGDLYGGKEPQGLIACDMTLYDASGSLPITRLGKQEITVQLPMPEGNSAQNLHVVTIDQDGQLEALEHKIINTQEGDLIQFTTSHFSPLGIYNYSIVNGQAEVVNGSAVITSLTGKKDDTPDTGDFIHPKWVLAIGLAGLSVVLFFYKGKNRNKLN